MLKEVKYETHDVNEIFIDIADEIKNGWKLHSFGTLNFEPSFSCKPNITMEVVFNKGRLNED